MGDRLRLILFDVDGTLVDSQGLIYASMRTAFETCGLTPPERQWVVGRIGLSLDQIVADHAPAELVPRVVEGYKVAYFEGRERLGTVATSPLFDGIRDVLDTLRSQDWTLLGVATGKSKRGLDKLIEGHSLNGYFVTQQVADFHPSKPHPSMVLAALSDTGVDPDDAVLIGDTAFDVEMGRAAGIRTIGVNWGYHSADRLAAAHRTVDHPTELLEAIDQTLGA
jgi:phosphoglycolate phosphatase